MNSACIWLLMSCQRIASRPQWNQGGVSQRSAFPSSGRGDWPPYIADNGALGANPSIVPTTASAPMPPWPLGSCVRRRRAGGGEDHVGGLFGDHDGRRVGVAAYQRRHHRGVDDAQPVDAVDPQFVCRPRRGRRGPIMQVRPGGRWSRRSGGSSARALLVAARSPGRAGIRRVDTAAIAGLCEHFAGDPEPATSVRSSSVAR